MKTKTEQFYTNTLLAMLEMDPLILARAIKTELDAHEADQDHRRAFRKSLQKDLQIPYAATAALYEKYDAATRLFGALNQVFDEDLLSEAIPHSDSYSS